jgi:hypothetical protein
MIITDFYWPVITISYRNGKNPEQGREPVPGFSKLCAAKQLCGTVRAKDSPGIPIQGGLL